MARAPTANEKGENPPRFFFFDKGDAIILLVEDYPCLNINEEKGTIF